MATRTFQLRTEPHVAEIGDDIKLLFQPEVVSDEFLDKFEVLQVAKRDLGNLEDLDADQLRTALVATREFLAGLMLPESAREFVGMRLPDRVLVELLEWVLELYGGGNRPTGSSNGSAPASPPAGKSSTGNSRSRGSTRVRGR